MLKILCVVVVTAWVMVQFPGALDYARNTLRSATPEKVVSTTVNVVTNVANALNDGIQDKPVKQQQW